MADLKSINDVQIFASGTWNGDTYTDADLDEMVQAFNDNKEKLKPYLKLGHDENQKILQADGLPAAGWIGRLYRAGSVLYADFIDLPQKIYDLIIKGAYKKVSSEIFWNIDLNGNKYSRMLAGVALLGSDMPAVTCLNDILAFYGLGTYESLKSFDKSAEILIKSYVTNDKEAVMPKTEAEIKLEMELQTKIEKEAELTKGYTTVTAEKAALEVEIAELKKFKADAEAKALADAEALKVSQIKQFVTELKSEKLITKAQEEYAIELMSEKKEYAVKEKKFATKQELFKEFLKLHAAADVNVDEHSSAVTAPEDNDEEATVKAINKYAKENKVSIKAATKAVLAEKRESAQ